MLSHQQYLYSVYQIKGTLLHTKAVRDCCKINENIEGPVSRVFVSLRHLSETWRMKSDMNGQMSGSAHKHRMQVLRKWNFARNAFSLFYFPENTRNLLNR